MTKVYVLTDGVYSDRVIDAVYSSREKAEAFLRERDGVWLKDTNIIEMVLDKDPTVTLSGGKTVLMRRDGDVLAIEPAWGHRSKFTPRFSTYRGSENTDSTMFLCWHTRNLWQKIGRDELILINSVAPEDPHTSVDVERAIKVTNELRTRLIANGEWPETQDE